MELHHKWTNLHSNRVLARLSDLNESYHRHRDLENWRDDHQHQAMPENHPPSDRSQAIDLDRRLRNRGLGMNDSEWKACGLESEDGRWSPHMRWTNLHSDSVLPRREWTDGYQDDKKYTKPPSHRDMDGICPAWSAYLPGLGNGIMDGIGPRWNTRLQATKHGYLRPFATQIDGPTNTGKCMDFGLRNGKIPYDFRTIRILNHD